MAIPIGELVSPVQTWTPERDAPDQPFTYIDLSSIDPDTKQIIGHRQVLGADAPSRARQIAAGGDILVSTVRPNLNGVARLPSDWDKATASTGFCVLRPLASKLDGGYLFHWVRSPRFVAEMVRRATGASYPAVSDRIVLESGLPLPSLSEQRRIAEILDKADALRATRRTALAQLDTLTKAIFLNMFANPKSRSWEVSTVAGVAEATPGAIRTGPFGSQLLHGEFTASGVAVLGIDNAVTNEFTWSERRFISEAKYRQLKRYTVRPGDVLITIMGTCGRCAVVPSDIPTAINTKHLCCITVDRTKCLPEFLHACFLRHPMAATYLRRTSKGAIMSGLNMGIIEEMPLALPPIELQAEFVRRIAAIGRVQAANRMSLHEVDSFFASLQHRAFRGDL